MTATSTAAARAARRLADREHAVAAAELDAADTRRELADRLVDLQDGLAAYDRLDAGLADREDDLARREDDLAERTAALDERYGYGVRRCAVCGCALAARTRIDAATCGPTCRSRAARSRARAA